MDANYQTPNSAATPDLGASTEADIERLREEIGETLRALEEKLNVGKRVDEATDRAFVRVVELKRTKPIAFVAGVAGIAIIAGVVVWSTARKLF
ncbi:DUF3618 domain-containing protein [Lysinibacter cavernae]|uniref:ElaB/YqjD/DUF883 family membrane-anchored ribosome-binding protein n=1 Tax=Lysinibacter cavernae TaxID=1640652 RepID=A0A7X5TUT0_9MICO|nr:DUF3618 domain-containing protein [Lysinibacter cavernae]NIH54894.1 ElaB/YqjD/DUF883 family membrane-anchored ribosome-binding protein [Lysinibacter cavernae]